MKKTCTKCKQQKSITLFSKDTQKKDGRCSACKSCNHQHYSKNKESIIVTQKVWRSRNPDRIKELNDRWYATNKQYSNRCSREYQRTHRPSINKWYSEKYHSDIGFRISQNYRTRIRRALKNNWKSGNTLKLLGGTPDELKAYLEKQFQVGMSWQNYGKTGWHIDHILPCASFDLSDPEQQKKCFHFTNLQPLWESDNIQKSDKC